MCCINRWTSGNALLKLDGVDQSSDWAFVPHGEDIAVLEHGAGLTEPAHPSGRAEKDDGALGQSRARRQIAQRLLDVEDVVTGVALLHDFAVQ